MKKAKEDAVTAEEGSLNDGQLQKFDRRYVKIIGQAYAENPLPENTGSDSKRGPKKKGKTRSLIERLDKHKASVCLFIHDFKVPFDNNQAERDCRMIKTKTKVSGCFRSLVGAENYLKSCRLSALQKSMDSAVLKLFVKQYPELPSSF